MKTHQANKGLLAILLAGQALTASAQGLPMPAAQTQQSQSAPATQAVGGQQSGQPQQQVAGAPGAAGQKPMPPQGGSSVPPPSALPPLPASAPAGPNFDDALSTLLGLTPDQIRDLRKAANARQRAASEYPVTPPKPVNTSVVASLAPGSTPPVIRLFPGFATSIVVTDATGAAWPIENFAVGHKDLFDVKRLDSGVPGVSGSTLSIVPLGYYAQSNIVLHLKGSSTPVSISFVSGQKEVDFRADVRVQGRGPNAQLAAAGLPASTNTQLLSLLEGVFPSDAKRLRSSSSDVEAWMTKSGRLFVRTGISLISPAWIGSIRSPDGTTAYEMMPTNSVLVMRDGQIKQIAIEGW